MGKDKLRRFELMKDFANVFQPTISEPFPLKGKWRQEYFKNDNPIILELGCGKGEYSVGLANHFPNKNFIGVDIVAEDLTSLFHAFQIHIHVGHLRRFNSLSEDR